MTANDASDISVVAWTPLQVQRFLRRAPADERLLVDVRTPQEYHRWHLDNATNLPLTELPGNYEGLPADSTLLLYCTCGMRSQTAAHILARAGFPWVLYMSGGLEAWNSGMAPEPVPEEQPEYCRYDVGLEAGLAAAWEMKAGTRYFYEALMALQPGLRPWLEQLSPAEERHQQQLLALCRSCGTQLPPTGDTAGEQAEDKASVHIMEGGIELDYALLWAQEQSLTAVVELCMALEANALERYQGWAQLLPPGPCQQSCRQLAGEERQHLKLLGTWF